MVTFQVLQADSYSLLNEPLPADNTHTFTTQSSLITLVRSLFEPSLSDLEVWNAIYSVLYNVTPNPLPLLTAGVAGDPYMYPLVGSSYKLRDCNEVYRGLETKDGLFCNFKVQMASAQHQEAIRRHFRGKLSPEEFGRLVCDGYYITSVVFGVNSSSYIHWELTHDFVAKDTFNIVGEENFAIHMEEELQPPELHECLGYARSVTIRHKRTETCIRIRKYLNPQASVALEVVHCDLKHSNGLLIRHHRPTLACSIPDIMCFEDKNVSRRISKSRISHTSSLLLKSTESIKKIRTHPKWAMSVKSVV